MYFHLALQSNWKKEQLFVSFFHTFLITLIFVIGWIANGWQLKCQAVPNRIEINIEVHKVRYVPQAM